jgi:hypothetical protein
VIGHELNNVAVPLEGFAELALQNPAASESVGHMLDEIKIAIARIKSLAADLETLGHAGSSPSPVAIGDCLPEEAGSDRPRVPEIDWRCSPATLVVVDGAHAKRALQALAGIAGRTGTQIPSLPGWSVARQAAVSAACAACGRTLPRKEHVRVQAFSSRAVPGEALKDPFGWPRVGRALRRLGLAVLVHSTHHAGGHIILDPGAGSVSLAFPLAPKPN